MCTGSCHTAEQTEKLFKNLSVDFQKIRQRQRISGVATEQPALRNSHELYIAFDQYFALYFPQGGSTVPPFVMTEKSVSIFSESAASDFLGETSGSTSTFPLSLLLPLLSFSLLLPLFSFSLLLPLLSFSLLHPILDLCLSTFHVQISLENVKPRPLTSCHLW